MNKIYLIFPKTEWATKMTEKYGYVLKVGVCGYYSTMFVNKECTDVTGNSFVWGFWLDNEEFEIKEIQTNE